MFSWTFVAVAFLVIATLAACIKARKTKSEVNGYYPILNLDTVWGLTLFFVELGLLFGLAFTGESPFVYFQF